MTEPNLQFPAVSCENLRFSAVSYALQMLEFPGERVNLQKSVFFCARIAKSPKVVRRESIMSFEVRERKASCTNNAT